MTIGSLPKSYVPSGTVPYGTGDAMFDREVHVLGPFDERAARAAFARGILIHSNSGMGKTH